MGGSTILTKRLQKIWETPDFSSFFKAYASAIPLIVKKGNTFLYAGDEPQKLHLIEEGFVKLYRMSPEGRDTIIYLYGPGSILGVRAFMSQDKRLRHSAETLTDCKLVAISEADYITALTEHPEHIIDLLHVFMDRLNYTERKLEGFILTDSTAHVASFLWDVADRFGRKQEKSIILPLPLTHQRIAEFVGAFRETVTVALNRLKKDGIITIADGYITILNLEKLKEQALIG